MEEKSLLPRLEALARRAAEPLGVEVEWVELKRQRSSWVVRVFIDRESGVGLRECETVSERLGVILDVEDPIDSSYTLEVSTPGLDRPLRTERDYERFAGRLARIKTREPIEQRTWFRGRLGGVEADSVVVETEGERWRIPLSLIDGARLEVEVFPPRSQGRPARHPTPPKERRHS